MTAFSSYPSNVVAASSSEEEYSFPSLPIKQVRFSKTSSFILVRDRTIGIEDKLWYSSEEVDYFKAEANFIVRDVRRKLSRLCLHSGTDDISSLLDSLEGYSCDELFGLTNRISLECLARRQLLMTKVVEEHLWQRLRSRVGGGASSSSSANNYCDAEMERQRLASISEEHSRWARQRARYAALLLQNEVSYGGKAWRRASQLCTDPERARASKVRRRA